MYLLPKTLKGPTLNYWTATASFIELNIPSDTETAFFVFLVLDQTLFQPFYLVCILFPDSSRPTFLNSQIRCITSQIVSISQNLQSLTLIKTTFLANSTNSHYSKINVHLKNKLVIRLQCLEGFFAYLHLCVINTGKNVNSHSKRSFFI